MKHITKSLLAAALAATAFTALAQDGGRPGRPEGGPRRGGSPIIAVLDADKDGEFSAAEIANAKAALTALDKNSDGAVTKEELRPGRPGGRDGDGAPEGNRPPRDEARPEGMAQRPVPPVMAALDKNADGQLDATEIAGASAALATLDKDADGKLAKAELHGPRPEGGRGPGGPGGPEGKKGPRGQRPVAAGQ